MEESGWSGLAVSAQTHQVQSSSIAPWERRGVCVSAEEGALRVTFS